MRNLTKAITTAATTAVLWAATVTPALARYDYDYYYDATDAGVGAGLGLGIMCFYCCAILGGFAIAFVIAYLVYKDAKKQGVENEMLWALLCFFTGLIGVALYFLVGRQQAIDAQKAGGTKAEEAEVVEEKEDKKKDE